MSNRFGGFEYGFNDRLDPKLINSVMVMEKIEVRVLVESE